MLQRISEAEGLVVLLVIFFSSSSFSFPLIIFSTFVTLVNFEKKRKKEATYFDEGSLSCERKEREEKKVEGQIEKDKKEGKSDYLLHDTSSKSLPFCTEGKAT